MAATVRGSRIAAMASGSDNASQHSDQPPREPARKTVIRGRETKKVRNAPATRISTSFVSGASSAGLRNAVFCAKGSGIPVSPSAPGLDQVDDQKHSEGYRQHDGGD